MPRPWLVAVTAIVTALLAIIALILWRRRLTSEGKERKRRKTVHELGRMATGSVTEFQGDVVSFTYSIRGIEYQATQDISGLRAVLPADGDHLLVGPCGVKYLPENPANSIVISEDWNGLRPAKRG